MGDQAAVGGRYGYWFPLVLLGFGLLVLLGWDSVQVREDFGWFAYEPTQEFESVQQSYTAIMVVFDQSQFPVRDTSWALLVIATLVATAAWYGWRARRAGGSVRTYVTLAVVGVLSVPVAYFAAGMAGTTPDPASLLTSVGLPLLGLGALAGAWAYLRPGPWRRAAAMISVVSLVIGVGLVLGAWSPGLIEPVIITFGLLALARFERSRLLAAVAGVVLVAMVVFPFGTMSLLAPAAVLLLGGIVALVRQSGLPSAGSSP
ncbi:hypothetical protein [Actinophytocola sp.]|uniref:hypothetical protein n=1 Tax=Actinophytocola sp. TaxID=1872138 RepID=UPI002ED48FDE